MHLCGYTDFSLIYYCVDIDASCQHHKSILPLLGTSVSSRSLSKNVQGHFTDILLSEL